MKVYVYPVDKGGCGYYRLTWPAMALRKMGHDVRIVDPHAQNRMTGRTYNGELVTISVPADADVMVFQRVTSRHIISGIKTMRDHGVAVVLDIDDDLQSIHPSNPAFASLHPNKDISTQLGEYTWHNFQRACEMATMVTVSTPALAQRYMPLVDHSDRGRTVKKRAPDRVRVLHNAVPEVMTRIVPRPEPRVVGWSGALHVHSDDPQVVGSSLARLQREGFKIKIIGPAHGTQRAFQLDDPPIATDLVTIGRYPHEMSQLEVGVAPLNDTAFNEAKSWLKMLEYAALGVPCVGSPRAEYRRLHGMGIGLLASNPREWYRHIRRLLDDQNLRLDLAAEGRQVVRERLTIEANAWRWWEAWSDALAIERGPLGQRRPLDPTTADPERATGRT